MIALGACASEPDSVVTVQREGTDRVNVQLCESPTAACPQQDLLFAAGEPAAATHTIGIYLDTPADSLALVFTTFQLEDNLCHHVIVPFTGDGREVTVTLRATLDAPVVDGCDTCDAGICQ